MSDFDENLRQIIDRIVTEIEALPQLCWLCLHKFPPEEILEHIRTCRPNKPLRGLRSYIDG